MKLIRFLKNHGKYKIGHVIGTKDSDADQLVFHGVAEYQPEGIKPLKYAAGKAPQVECVSMPIEEMEASPKGAKWPEQIETAVADEEIETADIKHKQKQLKK